MRLTSFSDFSLRLLMYAAARPDRLVTIEETAHVSGSSRAHLQKVAHQLARADFIEAVRGRTGGLKLAKAADKIRLGEVLRITEPDFNLVECFSPDSQCVISLRCRLNRALDSALEAFMREMDGYTLADLVLKPHHFLGKPAA
jgi:Rrf2 family nitric oxide-sensitive transcriptional repressor